MVDFYKHDIPDWMDGTEKLDSAAYRTYHVIVQLIYQKEGPVRNNEQGIAGRCRQSIKTYRRALNKLVALGLLSLADGKLSNERASQELAKIDENRQHAAKGGQKSSGVLKTTRKSLKDKTAQTAPLFDDNSIRDKTREDSDVDETLSSKRGTRLPDNWKPRQEDINEAKDLLGEQQARNEFLKFRDYWKAQPGQRGVKLDWDATWRYWARNAKKGAGNGKDNSNRNRSGTVPADEAWENLRSAIEDEYDRRSGKDSHEIIPPKRNP